MAQSVIEALLKSKIGLDVNSIGAEAIASVISQRMADCGIADIVNYLGKLQSSTQEWEALIDSVIVPETWFFREPESFSFLKHYVLSEWLPKNPQGVLRVLSVPCSTGEEPYSIAIALLEAGLNPTKIYIDAVDISKKCLLKAQRAIYNQYSFRGNTQLFQQRYFQPTETGYHLCEQVRGMVNFLSGNLVDNNLLLGTPHYDIVFCRNLLIYFDRVTKVHTVKVLENLLTPGGLLFVGHAETGLLLNSDFVSVRQPLAFAYRKVMTSCTAIKEGDDKTTVNNHPLSDRKPRLTSIISPRHPKPHISEENTKINHQISTRNIPDNLLETAKILANQGCLDEAIQICNSYLSQNRGSIEAYVLLGQVQQAMAQNEQAAQSFQKAIYLQPTHEEALTHLALLREHQGNIGSANLLWQRIHRLKKQ